MRVHKFIANCEQQTTTMSNAQQRTAKVRNARQRVPSRRWRCRSKYTRVGDVPAVHKLSDNTSVRPSSSSPCMWWGQAAGRQAARGASHTIPSLPQLPPFAMPFFFMCARPRCCSHSLLLFRSIPLAHGTWHFCGGVPITLPHPQLHLTPR